MALPCEMLDEILIRLPVKHLLRCRCVSKGWCALIDSTPFVKKHLKTTIDCNTGGGTLIIHGANGKFYLADFQPFDGGEDDATAVPLENETLLGGADIVGVANGLVCVSQNEINDLLLFNPATRKLRKIPSAPSEFPRFVYDNESSLCGFGYDHLNDDYKVVKIADCFLRSCGIMVIVYSLKTNSWKRIHNVPTKTRFTTDWGTFSEGALHWLGMRRPEYINFTCCNKFLVVFDLGLEQFKEIPIPAMKGLVVNFSTRCVDSDGGSICIFDRYPISRTDVWLMNSSEAENPWSESFSVENHRTLGSLMFFRPVYFSRNGESVLLEVDKAKLVWYDLGRKIVKNVPIHGIPNMFDSHVYTESLVKLTEVELQKPSQDKPEIKQQKRKEDFLSKGFKLSCKISEEINMDK